MRRPAAVLALAAAFLLAGCGSGAPAEPGPPDRTDPPAPRAVELSRSGGIAGIRESITVDPAGGWRHTTRTAETTGTLPADQLDRLTRMAADPALAAEATRTAGDNTCADGYDLGLTIEGTTVRWQECGPDSGAPPLSAQIARLLLESVK